MQSQKENPEEQITNSNTDRDVPSESSEKKDNFQDSDKSPTPEKNHPYTNTLDTHSPGATKNDSDTDSSESDTDSDGWGYDVGLPTPPIICSNEIHPYFLYTVRPWPSAHCLEYGGIYLVIAKSEEECCDILKEKCGGRRSEIECNVRYGDGLRLASSSHTSGIWMKILH